MLASDVVDPERGLETHDLTLHPDIQASLHAPRGGKPSFVQRTHLAKLDVVDLFRPKNDLELRHDMSVKADQPGVCEFREAHLAAMCEDIEWELANGHYDSQTRVTLQHRIDEARKALHDIIHDKDDSTYFVLLATRILMPILPVSLPALSKPEPQWNGLAVIIAAYTKTTLQALAQALNPTANNSRTFDRFMQRDLANDVQSALLLLNFFAEPAIQKVARSLAYNLPVAAAGFVILMTLYSCGTFVENKKNQLYGPGLMPGEREASDDGLRALSARTSASEQAAMLDHAAVVADLRSCVQDSRTVLKLNNGELTDPMNWQVGRFIGKLEKLQHALEAAGSGGAKRAKVKRKDGPPNPDRSSKLIMAAVAGGVLFAPFIPVTGAFLKELVPADEAGVVGPTQGHFMITRHAGGAYGAGELASVRGHAGNASDDVLAYIASIAPGTIEELPDDNDETPDIVTHLSAALHSREAANKMVLRSRFETIPAVDLGVDFCISMVKLVRDAFDHTKDTQDSLDTFSQWVGLSGIMAIVFGAGVKGNKFSKGGKDWIIGAASLNVGNLLLAALVGKSLGYGVSTTGKVASLFLQRVFGRGAHITVQALFDCFKSGDMEGAQKALTEIGQRMVARSERRDARQLIRQARDPSRGLLAAGQNVSETGVAESETIPEIDALPETVAVRETASLPETATVPEIATVPETATLPETAAVAEIAALPEIAPSLEIATEPATVPDSAPTTARNE